jgi:hypothetical protein
MAEELAKKVCGEVLAGLDGDVLEYIAGCVLDNDNLLPKEVKVAQEASSSFALSKDSSRFRG